MVRTFQQESESEEVAGKSSRGSHSRRSLARKKMSVQAEFKLLQRNETIPYESIACTKTGVKVELNVDGSTQEADGCYAEWVVIALKKCARGTLSKDDNKFEVKELYMEKYCFLRRTIISDTTATP